jgi:hypothetical protein
MKKQSAPVQAPSVGPPVTHQHTWNQTLPPALLTPEPQEGAEEEQEGPPPNQGPPATVTSEWGKATAHS